MPIGRAPGTFPTVSPAARVPPAHDVRPGLDSRQPGSATVGIDSLQSMQEMIGQLQQRLQVLTAAERAEATETGSFQNVPTFDIGSTQGRETVSYTHLTLPTIYSV